MSASTGPIIAAGTIVIFNHVIIQERSPRSQTPVLVASLIAAGGLSLWERAMPRTATAIAWLVLLSTLIVRVDPATPSPLESFDQWYRN